jgi:hypothetical protein
MVQVGPIHKETRGKWFWSLSDICVVILTRNRGILMHPFGFSVVASPSRKIYTIHPIYGGEKLTIINHFFLASPVGNL